MLATGDALVISANVYSMFDTVSSLIMNKYPPSFVLQVAGDVIADLVWLFVYAANAHDKDTIPSRVKLVNPFSSWQIFTSFLTSSLYHLESDTRHGHVLWHDG